MINDYAVGSTVCVFGWPLSNERFLPAVHVSVYNGCISLGLTLSVGETIALIDELNKAIVEATAVQDGL